MLNFLRQCAPFTSFFNALDNPDDIRSFRDRLRTLHLSETPNEASDYNRVVDVYDVFN
jgi:hypothetical protein